MNSILKKIVEAKKIRLIQQKKELPLEELKTKALSYNEKRPSFKSALSKKDGVNIIAEVKKASPSLGVIKEDFDYLDIAKHYEKGAAAAISVLTEADFFKGSNEYLENISKEVSIPILRKDFITDEYQIYEAKIIGASAILLIAAILSEAELDNFFKLAKSLGLDALIEVHNEEELAKVLNINADIIGINNRNLKDFSVDINTSAKLAKLIPEGTVIVVESGIKNAQDIKFYLERGLNNFLIGERLMLSENIEQTLSDLLNAGKI